MVKIGRRQVGDGAPTFIIAEIGANHDGSFDDAVELVRAAAHAGADAVKLQTYGPDDLTLDSDAPSFQVTEEGSLWKGRSLYDLYRQGATPWEWHAPLFEEAKRLGLEAFSTPFSPQAVVDLDALGVPAFKVASMENNHVPLLEAVGATGRPVIMSTGASTPDEVAFGIDVLRRSGARAIALLQCTSEYPAPPEHVHLRAMAAWSARHDCLAGLSDHTLGHHIAVAATALGAAIIEKHLTLDPEGDAIDARFSLGPTQFKDMVEAIRDVEAALGDGSLAFADEGLANRRYRRSIFVIQDVAQGDTITEKNIGIVRPADGLGPARWHVVLGKRFAAAAAAGTPLTDGMVDPT